MDIEVQGISALLAQEDEAKGLARQITDSDVDTELWEDASAHH